MVETKLIAIEIVYAPSRERQLLLSLSVPENCTVRAAIEQSGILGKFPEIDLTCNKVGIFSKPITLDSLLRAGDRIEIYTPLLIDPKQARRQRAQRQKSLKLRRND